MCHKRGEWSRTSSRVSESEAERDEEKAWWPSRAKERLVTFVSAGGGETTDETPESDRERPEIPAVDPEPETPSADPTESELEDEADDPETEREEDPIPADD
jgi:hypothetical protein